MYDESAKRMQHNSSSQSHSFHALVYCLLHTPSNTQCSDKAVLKSASASLVCAASLHRVIRYLNCDYLTMRSLIMGKIGGKGSAPTLPVQRRTWGEIQRNPKWKKR